MIVCSQNRYGREIDGKLATSATFADRVITTATPQISMDFSDTSSASRMCVGAAGSSSSSHLLANHESRVAAATRKQRAAKPSAKGQTTLSLHQARNIRNGVEAAIALGLPLNRFITINWEQAGVADPVGATGKLLKLIRDALRKADFATAHVWVQEGGARVGQHVHILVHLPRAFRHRFNRLYRGWLKRCGASLTKGIIHSKPVAGDYTAAFGDDASRANYRHNLGLRL